MKIHSLFTSKKIKYTEIRAATLEWTEIQILRVYLSAKHFWIRRGERSRWRREADMMAKREKKKDGLIQRQTKLPTLSAKGFLIQHTLMNKWLKVLSAGSWEEHTHTHIKINVAYSIRQTPLNWRLWRGGRRASLRERREERGETVARWC